LPGFGMLRAVQLHDDAGAMAREIENVGPERNLPAKPQPGGAPEPQPRPEKVS
jgi:hypothetical protein